MKKVVLLIIVIGLILVTIFQSVLSANEIFVNEERDKSTGNSYNDYRNCTIKTHGNVDGRAILFPGYWFSLSWFDSNPGVNVKRASGILFGDGSHFTNLIYFNGDHYYIDWIKAYVFSFTGYFSNYWDIPGVHVFDMNGRAEFVRVYYS